MSNLEEQNEVKFINYVIKQIKNSELSERELKKIFQKYAEGEIIHDKKQ